jgi:hypothetical protein
MKTIDRINLNGTEYIIQDSTIQPDIEELKEEVRELADHILDTYTKEETNTLLESYLTKLEANSMVANYAVVEDTTLKLNNQEITV